MLSSRVVGTCRLLRCGSLSHCQIAKNGSLIRKRLMGNSSNSTGNTGTPMSKAEREATIREANQAMKGYVETRILAKQGKLKSKNRGQSQQTKSATAIQLSLFIGLAAAFLASPILGKKIAQDDEFRKKYIPAWYDFRVKAPTSAWTRQELHEQLVEVEHDMRERAVRGEFTPDKLEELKRSMQPRSDLTEEDMMYAKKYGWGRIHPGIDPDDEDDYDDDDE